MGSDNYSGEMTEEQIAEQFHEMIQEAVDDWVSSDDCEAYREGRYVCIAEEELVKNILVMAAMTVSEFSED
jgi:LAS superfamily LD-carboxypeptidase LdcB